jgi:hypothetical protein
MKFAKLVRIGGIETEGNLIRCDPGGIAISTHGRPRAAWLFVSDD